MSVPLPPHAPCRLEPAQAKPTLQPASPLPPHAPCRLEHKVVRCVCDCVVFASTRPVQIGTSLPDWLGSFRALPPHAPCRLEPIRVTTWTRSTSSLPPHAPCRLERESSAGFANLFSLPPHAPCRLEHDVLMTNFARLAFASTRPVQIGTAEMHRIAICTFQNVC